MSQRFHDRIDELASGYQASQILLVANRLGLFAAIGKGSKTVEELASELDASERGIRIVCDALVALGLLERTESGYRNSEEAEQHLLPDSPQPRIHQLLHGAKLYERWGHLFDIVKTGRPIAPEDIDPRLVGDERSFARAMADLGQRSAVATCEVVDLDGVGSLLDIGGGPGIYAIEFARRYPSLEVTVLDNQEALEVAKQNIEAAGLAERIHLLPGDAFHTDLGGPYDAIFLSNVIHIYSAEENQKLIQRCADSLAPGGQLLLKDFFLDEDRQHPPGGPIFAVNMLVNTEEGDCYAVEEARSWIESASMKLEEVVEVASKSRLLAAVTR